MLIQFQLMPRSHFSWSKQSKELLSCIARHLEIEGEAEQVLADRFGIKPKEDFVREAWPALLSCWLSNDDVATTRIAKALRSHGLGQVEITDDYEYLGSCRNAMRLRKEVLLRFLDLEDKSYDGDVATSRTQWSHLPDEDKKAARSVESAIPEKAKTEAFPRPPIPTAHDRSNIDYALPEKQLTSDASASRARIHKKDNPSFLGNLCLARRPAVIAAFATACVATAIIAFSEVASFQNYSRTVELGRIKHVQGLLSLSETGPSIQKNLDQLNSFRRSNWRNFLAKESMLSLDQKGVRLNRAIEVERLNTAVEAATSLTVNEKNVQSALETLDYLRRSSAYKYLGDQAKEAVASRIEAASALRTSMVQRQSEAARVAKEAALLAERVKKEEEARLEREKEAQAEARRLAEEQSQAENIRQAEAEASAPQESNSSEYQLGPRGGCFYWSGNRKIYVGRSNCN